MLIKFNEVIKLVKNKQREWEFPGGKVEFDRDTLHGSCELIDLIKSAKRELEEEAGTDIEISGSPNRIIYKQSTSTSTSHTVFLYTHNSLLVK